MAIPPSGQQFGLQRGDVAVTVVEVGGGLRQLTAGAWDVLDGYDLDQMCTSGRGQILVPWPNRVDHGEYEFGGRRLQLSWSEPAQQNAIHGLARWSAWRVAEHGGAKLALEHVIPAQVGYPFTVHVRLDYELAAAGLTVRCTATNLGAEPCPFGAGAHPYVRVGDGLIDDAVLQFDAGTWYETDARQIPTGRAPVAGSPFDYRVPHPLGRTVMDTAFTDLGRDPDGRARVRLSSADGARTVTVWLDENYRYLMLFTGDTLPPGEGRRHGLGVEPMTCAPNAFASGDGLRVLQPGEPFSAAWGIELAQQA